MIICFDATREAKSVLDDLLVTSDFNDVSEAISVALVSYGAIHRSVSKERHPSSASSNQMPNESTPTSCLPSTIVSTEPPTRNKDPRIEKVPMLLQASETPPDISAFVTEGECSSIRTDMSPKSWLFGQFNRFLPTKVTCRGLLNLLRASPGGINLDHAVSKISLAACSLGDYLRALDKRYQFGREEYLSAAFPSTDEARAESRVRFGNQFVGTNKQGRLTGMPAALRLIGCDKSKSPRILLTKQGLEFALIPNPVLDGGFDVSKEKFSQEERIFLRNHIAHHVPEDLSAYVAIFEAIEAGSQSPEAMDGFLRKRYGLDPQEKDEGGFSSAFLATQRSGTVARLVDLGLVRKQKTGLRVAYFLTEEAQVFRSQLKLSSEPTKNPK